VDATELAHGRTILAALRRLVRDRLARRADAHLIEGRLPEFSIELDIAPEADASGEDGFAQRLVESVDARLDEAVRHAAWFLPGRAFCLRCGGSECAHARPPSARHVLHGYGPTGTPLWSDFAQVLLDSRVEGVEELYGERPGFRTVVQGPEQVHAGLLDVFAHPSYRLYGQLLAGYFAVRAREPEGRGVVALTIQVAGTRTRRGVRLGLNVVGTSPSGEGLETLWERHRDLPWRRGVRWAQTALTTVRGGRREDDPRLRERVLGILRSLARRMEREQRARRRRTAHAEDRPDAGGRPTRMAAEDLRAASGADVLVDERSHAVVVLGARGRTHFFGEDGRLVSSVRYSRDAIERKIRAGLWRAAAPDEVARLRERAADVGGE